MPLIYIPNGVLMRELMGLPDVVPTSSSVYMFSFSAIISVLSSFFLSWWLRTC